MRKNLKRRVGVWSALTLLTFMLMPVLSAGAQATTGEIAVQANLNNGTGGLAQRSDLSFQVNGGAPIQFNSNGVNVLTLDVATPVTVTPVAFDGYTVTIDENIPGITCTNVTLDPATQAFCRFTFTWIEPPTTTTTTTTTTTIPEPTTIPVPDQEPVTSTGTDLNACTTQLVPDLQPPGETDITTTIKVTAFGQPHLNKPIRLSGTNLTLKIPASLLQLGFDAGLIKNGDQVPSTVTLGVAGSNTAQGKHTYVIKQTSTIVIKGGKAQPLNANVNLPSTDWTPTGGNVIFTQTSLKIVANLNLPGIGKVTVTFRCDPRTAAQFAALGESGAIDPGGNGGGGGGGGGTTDPTVAPGAVPGGSNELPRTGSAPWPLIVVGAALIDIGIIAIAGSKRRRRPLHHS